MSNFFDALKKASDDAGVPTPTMPVLKPKSQPEPQPEPATEPAEPHSDEMAANDGVGMHDAADSDCITPDGWYVTEALDDLYDEEDN